MSFWFMLSILIGSERGNVDPATGLEKVVTIIFEMIGCVIFGVIQAPQAGGNQGCFWPLSIFLPPSIRF